MPICLDSIGLRTLCPFLLGSVVMTNREMMEVTSLLFLLEGCFREGRRDVCVWNPNPIKSLFSLLLDPPPPGLRFPRKLGLDLASLAWSG